MYREARNLLWFFGSFSLVCFVGAISGCTSVPLVEVHGNPCNMAPASRSLVLWTQSSPF